MSDFNPHVKIERFLKNFIRIPDLSIFPPSEFELSTIETYDADNVVYRKYSYSDLQGLTIIDESTPITIDGLSSTAQLQILSDGRIVILLPAGAFTGDEFGVWLLNSDTSVIGFYRGVIGGDSSNTPIYLSSQSDKDFILISNNAYGTYPTLEKYDLSMTRVLEEFTPDLARHNILYDEDRLFTVTLESSTLGGAEIFELSLSDFGILNSRLAPLDIGSITHTKDIMRYTEDRLLVYAVSDAFDGVYMIYDKSLNLIKALESVNGNWTGGGFSDLTRTAVDLNGFIYSVNTDDNKIYKIDPDTNTAVWEKQVGSAGAISGSSRPKSLSIDTYGNLILAMGIGSDDRRLLLLDNDGNLIIEQDYPDELYTAAVHYHDFLGFI